MVRRMRRVAWAAALLVTVTMAGCAKPAKQAAPDVLAFLTAVKTQDQTAFEAGVDRTAVRRALRAQLVDLARAAGVEVEGGPSEFALDRMINPDNIRLAGDTPSVVELGKLLKPVDDKRVCLPDRTPEQNCLLTFERQKDDAAGKAGWKLVRMPAAHVPIDVSPPATKS
jgi:hypothetical protein